jgi:hypothetical protein
LSGPIGTEIDVIGALLLIPSFFILGIVASIRSPLDPTLEANRRLIEWILRYRLLLAVSASCALIIAAILWVKVTFSFYCATPNTIQLHPYPLGPWRNFTWDDVKVVQAKCWAGSRTPWQGGLSLILVDGETILLRFGSGHGVHGHEAIKRNYDAIKTALQGKKYQYDTSTIGVCTDNVRRILIHWPGELR